MYSKYLIERFQNPRNSGGMHGANAIGEVDGTACGDIVKLYLKIDNNNTIENARFKAFGCCATIALADVTCDLVKGKTIEQALKITNQDVINEIGEIPEERMICSVFSEGAIKLAIEDFFKRKEKEAKKVLKDAKG